MSNKRPQPPSTPQPEGLRRISRNSRIIYKNSTKLVLIRHGQSVWNKENKFTGLIDVELSEKGVDEALEAATLLAKSNIKAKITYNNI